MAKIFEATCAATVGGNFHSYVPQVGTGITELWVTTLNAGWEVNATTDLIQGETNASKGAIYTFQASGYTTDYYVEFDMVTLDIGTDDPQYWFVRIQDVDNLYGVRLNNQGGTNTCRLYKKVAGVWTALGSAFNPPANGSRCKIEIIGSTLKFYDDGVEVASATDTDITLAGEGGNGIGGGTELVTSTDDIQIGNTARNIEIHTIAAGGVAGSSLDARWSVAQLAGKSADLRWAETQLASKSLDAQWSLSQLISQSVDLRWGVASLAGRSSDLRWAVLGAAGIGADLRWQVLASPGNSTDLRWAVRSFAGRAVDLRWALRQLAGRSSDQRWAILGVAQGSADLRWSLAQLARRSFDARWSLVQLAGGQTDLRWQLVKLAGLSVDLRWAIGQLGLPLDLVDFVVVFDVADYGGQLLVIDYEAVLST